MLTQADTGSGARNNENFLNDAASFESSSPNSGCDVGEQEIDELVSFGASGEGSSLSGSPVKCDVVIDHEPIEGTESSSEPEAEMVEITPSEVDDVISEKIAEAILDALEFQLELKLSQVGLEKILDWGKKLFLMTNPGMDNLFPKNWSECVNVLKKVGYEDAKQYFIWFDDSRRCLYGLMDSRSQPCPHCGKRGQFHTTTLD